MYQAWLETKLETVLRKLDTLEQLPALKEKVTNNAADLARLEAEDPNLAEQQLREVMPTVLETAAEEQAGYFENLHAQAVKAIRWDRQDFYQRKATVVEVMPDPLLTPS
jgi:hypothetical protein